MNNLIIQNNESLTMTSSQLSELLNYPKKEINRKIKIMFSHKIEGGIISPTLRANNQVDEYNLPELESKMFVAKHDINYLETITQYWIDKSKPQLPDFNDAVLMARTWANDQEAKQAQARQLELQAPKVAFVDRFVESTGNKTFREVAKLLKANEREFRAFLVKSQVMYKLNKSWTARAQHLNAGRFSERSGEKNGRAFFECKFTPKGVEYIAGKWIAHKEIK